MAKDVPAVGVKNFMRCGPYEILVAWFNSAVLATVDDNLFVNYGAFGIFLLYSVFLILMFMTYRCCRRRKNIFPAIIMSAVVFYYLVFSFGYFFYAEPIVGGIAWLFFGSVYGYAMRRVV